MPVVGLITKNPGVRYSTIKRSFVNLQSKALSGALSKLKESGYIVSKTDSGGRLFKYYPTQKAIELVNGTQGSVAFTLEHADKKECDVLLDDIRNCPFVLQTRGRKARITTDSHFRGLSGTDEIVQAGITSLLDSRVMSCCSSIDALRLATNYGLDYFKQVSRLAKLGKHEGIFWLSPIQREDVGFVRMLLDVGISIRHIPFIPLQFFVTDRHFLYSSNMVTSVSVESAILTKEPSIVYCFNGVFQNLWSHGIDAQKRISELTENVNIRNTFLVSNINSLLDEATEKINAAVNEIQVELISTNSFGRLVSSPALSALHKATLRGIPVRVIIHANRQDTPELPNIRERYGRIEFRHSSPHTSRNHDLLIVDRNAAFLGKTANHNEVSVQKAVGGYAYSDNDMVVSMFAGAFDDAWKVATS